MSLSSIPNPMEVGEWHTIFVNPEFPRLEVEFRIYNSIPEVRISWFNTDRYFICNASKFYSALIAASCDLPLASDITVEAFNLFDYSPKTVKAQLFIDSRPYEDGLRMLLDGNVRIVVLKLDKLIPILQEVLHGQS